MTVGGLRLGLLATALVLSFGAFGQALPIGALAHDGPATPEQLSLLLPVTGSLPTTATATVRHKPSGTAIWITGHPLFRVRPGFSNGPAVGTVDDVFAWPIIDLTPSTTYDVEVTVTSGATTDVKTASFTTRQLPPPAPPPNKTIAAGSSASAIQSAINGLNPGDVLQFENGTYKIDNLTINRSGTANSPIYIRGASRAGVILSDPTDIIISFQNANHIIIENLTLLGAGVDGGTRSGHMGFSGGRAFGGTTRNTIRFVTVDGVDRGVSFYERVTEALIYDNTFRGNNVWDVAYLSDNRTWDDDGINVPGDGNVAFNNTISSFGDSFAYAQHVGNDTLTSTHGVHFYRNEIRNSGDDMVEFDHAHRNISFYDNRSHNSANCGSLDPLYGGPLVYARSICINPARVNTHKWNDQNTGQFLYNNTIIGTASAVGADPDVSAWYQPNNGPQQAYGYQNNVHVYRGNGNTLWLESTGHNPIDWTNNSWYPDRGIQWGGLYAKLAAAKSRLGNTTPVFSGTNRRMENDNITTSNPWTVIINLGANALTNVPDTYTPILSNGSSPKNSGVVISNITDGFSGAAPDRGAIISGRTLPVWGDRDSPAAPVLRPKEPAS